MRLLHDGEGRGASLGMSWLILAVACFGLTGCVGLTGGGRWHYKEKRAEFYAGSYARAQVVRPFGLSASVVYPFDSQPAWEARLGPELGLTLSEDLRQWEPAMHLGFAYGFGQGFNVQFSACAGMYNTTEFFACGRWSSVDWLALDLNAGFFFLALRDPGILRTGL